MKTKSKLILLRIAPVALLLSGPGLLAQDYQATLTPKPIPIEQHPASKADVSGSTTPGEVLSTAQDVIDTVIDSLKDNHWQQSVEWKSGNVYFLRRSTDEPVKPGEIVILRWRTPTEMKNKAFLYARNPRAQVEHPVPAPVVTPASANSDDTALPGK